MSSCCPVVELRQYTLRHGQRDVLIELFDREFVETQEAVGMEVIGQFRDLDRPERFVWMRGFPDMQRRREALEAFYGGPIWKAHAAAANATMVDVDDVLLLRPVAPSTGFEAQPRRPGQGADVAAANFAVTICSLSAPADPDVLTRTLLPALAEATPPSLATFVEEPSENTFRRSPSAPANMWSCGSNASSTRTGPRRWSSIWPSTPRPSNSALRRQRDRGCAERAAAGATLVVTTGWHDADDRRPVPAFGGTLHAALGERYGAP